MEEAERRWEKHSQPGSLSSLDPRAATPSQQHAADGFVLPWGDPPAATHSAFSAQP